MKTKGFTLIELMLALLITSIITIIVYSTFNNEIKTYVNGKKISNLKTEISLLLGFMERELRLAGFDSIGLADVGIEKATENKIVFRALNTTSTSPFEDNNDILRCVYYLDTNSNNTIKRYTDDTKNGNLPILNEDPGGNSLIEDVVTFKLTYYDSRGTNNGEIALKNGEISDGMLGSIRAVKINITIKADLWGRPAYIESVDKIINCRNMGI